MKRGAWVCSAPWEPEGGSSVLGFPVLVALDWGPEGCLDVGR